MTWTLSSLNKKDKEGADLVEYWESLKAQTNYSVLTLNEYQRISHDSYETANFPRVYMLSMNRRGNFLTLALHCFNLFCKRVATETCGNTCNYRCAVGPLETPQCTDASRALHGWTLVLSQATWESHPISIGL